MGRNKSLKARVAANSKLHKDPGVPRLPQLKLKNAAKKLHATEIPQPYNGVDVNMTAPLALSGADGEKSSFAQDESIPNNMDSSFQARRHYIRILHKVIELSDIVVHVLDARDPEGCMSRLVVEEVQRRESENKKLILVLNKVDLVPRSNAEAWIRHLRHTAPTIAFRASTQQQRINITSKTSSAFLKLIKAFKPAAQSVTVGIVGYPNVGKSSLINSLKRAKVCPVAAEPGWTKEMQVVQLERGVKLLDSPGVIFDSQDSENQNLLLRNVVKVGEIPDPVAIVSLICKRISYATLNGIYSLPPPPDDQLFGVQEFLVQRALTSGRLLKAGVPDIQSTARAVIHDWNTHKIPFHSEPPKIHSSSLTGSSANQGDVGGALVVTGGFGQQFSLKGLWDPGDSTTEQMDEDSNVIESDDVQPIISLDEDLSSAAPEECQNKQESKQPDYISRDYAYELSFMSSSNPMDRRSQRKQSKQERKKVKRHLQQATLEQIDGND